MKHSGWLILNVILKQRQSSQTIMIRRLYHLSFSVIPLLSTCCVCSMVNPRTPGELHIFHPWEVWALGINSVILMAGLIPLVFSLDRIPQQIKCPRCDKNIGHPQSLSVVIASSRCPNCTQKIVTDAACRSDEEFERDVIHGRCSLLADRNRQFGLASRFLLKWIALAVGYFVVANWLLKKNGLTVTAQMSAFQIELLEGALFIPAIAACMCGVLSAARYLKSQQKHCVRCGGVRDDAIIALTGRCGECGGIEQSDWIEESNDPTVAGGMAVADFRTRSLDIDRGIDTVIYRTLLATVPLSIGFLVVEVGTGKGVFYVLSVISIAILVLSMWITHGRSRQLCCPTCHASLSVMRKWVIATRRCVGCGQRVLRD